MMRAALFISGGGSTARRIIDESRSGVLKGLVEPVLVVASKPCGGIENSIAGGMPPDDVLMFRRQGYGSAEAQAGAMLKACRERGVDFVGLYGYTSLVHRLVIEAFPGMMVNQHPGPLDPPNEDFGGQGMVGEVVHRSVLAFASMVGQLHFPNTEATAHRVSPEYDKGVVVGRWPLAHRIEHSPESLAAELLPFEHLLQVEVIKKFAGGTVTELRRDQPLIKPEHVPILQEIKRMVIARHLREHTKK